MLGLYHYSCPSPDVLVDIVEHMDNEKFMNDPVVGEIHRRFLDHALTCRDCGYIAAETRVQKKSV